MRFTTVSLSLLTLTSCFIADSTDEQLSTTYQGAGIRGAIFTSLVDGSAVNHNIYEAKTAVYLDGGPSGGSPSSAAALAEGDYYFQVTDPSGKTLLSSDPIDCRSFHVSADGVITDVVGACVHATGIDQDYAALGAITVQLMPYDDTPNPGGEYKVWVTPVDRYTGSGRFHGFLPHFSKTDNFKVRPQDMAPPPACGDGHVDSGEQCDDGNTTNGDGCSATCQTETPPPPPSCGDGHLDAGEQCDDGNTNNGDGCSATCQTETTPPPPCCGDGHVDAGEQCDDGNTTSGDGCSATCQTETPPPPPPCCGDGHVDSGEQCDDGNTTSGDGCSSTCQAEVTTHPDNGALCDVCVSTMQTNEESVFVP